MLSREQFFLNLLFNKYLDQILNNSPTAGNNLGYKHKAEFGLKRSGQLNPMYGKNLSHQFILMQKRNKEGKNNPQFRVKKSAITIKKQTKLVYVYNSIDRSYIGTYSTVKCTKEFKMGKDTLSKYLLNKLPFKGKLFLRVKLHNF
jgi:group I intron endonuclease